MRWRLALLLLAVGGIAGCGSSEGGGAEGEDAPARVQSTGSASVTLRVAVAEDAALAKAISRLRGEWAEQSGGELVVEEWSVEEVLGRISQGEEAKPAADLLVFPTRHLGELCEAGRLRPMRKSVLQNENLRLNDFFPLVRERLLAFGGETMALPIGCVAPVLLDADSRMWRDFLVSPGVSLQPPSSEASYANALQLLMRVACYADSTRYESLVFDAETFQPRVVDPPFLKSLRDMVALYSQDRPFSAGRHARIVWPNNRHSHEPTQDQSNGKPSKAEGFSPQLPQPPPGVDEVYNPIAGEWEKLFGEPRRVPLLATSGRLVGVTSDTRNAASAFRLAGWLAGVQNARQLSTASPNVANVRQSLAHVADDWTGGGDKQLGKQFAAAQEKSLSHHHGLLIPRIIRIDDYLAAFDHQIKRALDGELSPEQTLANAAADWEKLTDEIGRDRQRECYVAHLQGM